MTTLDRLIAALNEYVFDKVWASPNEEHHRVHIPTLITPRSVTGVMALGGTIVDLPTRGEPYFVYSIHHERFGGPNVLVDEWTTVAEFMAQRQTKLVLNGQYGETLFRKQVFMTTSPDGQYVLFAVKKSMWAKCLEEIPDHQGIQPRELTVRCYYDSSYGNTKDTIVCHEVIDATTAAVAANAATAAADEKGVIFVNGAYYHPGSSITFKTGDLVEILVDHDIELSFAVDMNTNVGHRTFTIDGIRRMLFHVPKAENPDSYIYTFRNCDIYMYRMDPARPGEGRLGVALSDIHRNKNVVQFTHNDIGIPELLLDFYKEFMDTDSVGFRFVARRHNRDNKLIPDAAYINRLYTLDDETIMDFISGAGDPNLPWWDGKELIHNKYVEMFFEQPKLATATTLDPYVEALGYNHVMSIISQRVAWLDIDDIDDLSPPRTFRGRRPPIFNSGELMALVFAGGLKVYSDHVRVDAIGDDVRVEIDSPPEYAPGQKIMIELFEKHETRVYTFRPNAGNFRLKVPYDTINLYERFVAETPCRGIGSFAQWDYYYVKVPDNVVTNYITVTPDNGEYFIDFNPGVVDRDFVIQNKVGTFQQQVSITGILDQNMIPVHNVMITAANGAGEQVPYLSPFSVIAYLNGKELVQGVDFNLHKVTYAGEHESFYQVVFQNVSYIESGENTLDMVFSRDPIVGDYYGFADRVDPQVFGIDTFWYESASILSVNGLTVGGGEVNNIPGGVKIAEGYNEPGDLYGVRTIAPIKATDHLDDAALQQDTTRLEAINEYLTVPRNQLADIVIMQNAHKIYSTYFAMIVSDLLRGTLILPYDPNTETLLGYLEDYDRFKVGDVIYTAPPNDMYVDYYPFPTPLDNIPIDLAATILSLQDLLMPNETYRQDAQGQ